MGEAIPKLHITKGVLIYYLKVAVKRFFKRILINAFNATVCRSRCNVLAPIKPSCGKFHVVVSTNPVSELVLVGNQFYWGVF